MPALTSDQIARLSGLPRPPSPPVQLVDPRTGRATAAFTEYLTRLDEWWRRLVEILGE
jgi:hypothetical protein